MREIRASFCLRRRVVGIRLKVNEHMTCEVLLEKVRATIVHFLETTLIHILKRRYAAQKQKAMA
jgi:hypothetical protein